MEVALNKIYGEYVATFRVVMMNDGDLKENLTGKFDVKVYASGSWLTLPKESGIDWTKPTGAPSVTCDSLYTVYVWVEYETVSGRDNENEPYTYINRIYVIFEIQNRSSHAVLEKAAVTLETYGNNKGFITDWTYFDNDDDVPIAYKLEIFEAPGGDGVLQYFDDVVRNCITDIRIVYTVTGTSS